jgi:hypothetical protein
MRLSRTILMGLLVCGAFAACQDKVPDNVVAGCYGYTKGRDTVKMSMQIRGKEVSGDLTYNLYEKDKNVGSIAGELIGDTVLVDYTFNSEGSKSVRQVAFLKKGDQLTEGYGDVAEQNGKTVFKDRSKLKFAGIIVLSKDSCSKY